MADQDFKINIVTIADTTGIKLTQQQLEALQTAAANGNKQAIDALKKVELAQRGAEQAAKDQAQAQYQGLRSTAYYGLIIGGVVAKAIGDIAREQDSVTKELDKQGAALVKNVQLWQKLAESAKGPADIAGVGEKALAQIDQIQDKFKDANNEVLTLGQTMIDTLVAGFKNAFTFGGNPNAKGPFAALQDEKLKGLMQDLASAQQNAAETVKRGLDQQRDTHEDIDSVIKRETDHLSQQQNLLRNLDPRTQLQSWVAVEQTVERLTKKIAELNAQRDKQVKAGEPTTESGLLEKQLGDLTRSGRSVDLTPAEQEQRSQAEIATREKLFQKQISDREKNMQDAIKARDDRFTGKAPLAQPASGDRQSETNSAILVALNKLITLWQ